MQLIRHLARRGYTCAPFHAAACDPLNSPKKTNSKTEEATVARSQKWVPTVGAGARQVWAVANTGEAVRSGPAANQPPAIRQQIGGVGGQGAALGGGRGGRGWHTRTGPGVVKRLEGGWGRLGAAGQRSAQAAAIHGPCRTHSVHR